MSTNKTKIEVAIDIFKEKKCELSLNELFTLVADRLEIEPSKRQDKLVDFYTSLSSDGRFIFDKANKKWGLISLLNPEVVKENRTGFDDSDDEGTTDKEDDEEIIIENDDESYDDISSKELKKEDDEEEIENPSSNMEDELLG